MDLGIVLGLGLTYSLRVGSNKFSFWAASPRVDWPEADYVVELLEPAITADGIAVGGFNCREEPTTS